MFSNNSGEEDLIKINLWLDFHGIELKGIQNVAHT